MPPDDKRPSRALGFGLPELDVEPDAATVEDRLRAIEVKIDELLARGEKNKRGRPRDAHADALNELSEVGVLVLQEAIKTVQETLPEKMSLDILVAVNLVMDQVVREFGQLLPLSLA